MPAYHVIRPWEITQFRRCRRAWDLGARERQDYEPAVPRHVADFDEAIRDALDVYYFPGMWEWNRQIVRPLAVQAFLKSMGKQREAYARHRALTAAQEREWEQRRELGLGMLERYFGWAQGVDHFSPIQVAAQFDITIPQPGNAETSLIAADGRGVQFRVRIDMVVMDEHELCWLAEHRVTTEPGWRDIDELILDEQCLTRSWAWQLGFFGRIEGTIHNELRADVPAGPAPAAEVPEIRAVPVPSGVITQHQTEFFRRTQIPRNQAEFERRGVDVALEARDMTEHGVRLYPNPSWEHCADCDFRAPCVAMTQGLDERPILTASYRKRVKEDYELGRLGSVWGFVPETHRIADYRAPGSRAQEGKQGGTPRGSGAQEGGASGGETS